MSQIRGKAHPSIDLGLSEVSTLSRLVLLLIVQFSCSGFFSSWQPHGLWPARLLCPWDSPSKNTEVGCHALHQETFPTQGSNPCLLHHLHLQVGSLPLAPPAAKLRENQKNVSCLCTGEVFSFSLKQGGK